MAMGSKSFLASLLVFSLLGICGNVATRSDRKEPHSEENDLNADDFQQCVAHESRSSPGNTMVATVLPCMGKSALLRLMDAEEQERVTLVEGVVLERRIDDGKLARALYEQSIDPRDLQSMLEAASTFMERRSLRWDMSSIHPGLVLQVGPTLNGAGVLEFVMDPQQQSPFADRTVSTGRFMVRQFLLPLLLGFKLKLVTLIPLLLGLLVVVAKKALFLSKIALLVSGILGFATFSKFQQQQQQQKPISISNPFGGSFNDPQMLPLHNNIQQQVLLESFMEGVKGLPNYRERERNSGADRGARNFVWEDEKHKRP